MTWTVGGRSHTLQNRFHPRRSLSPNISQKTCESILTIIKVSSQERSLTAPFLSLWRSLQSWNHITSPKTLTSTLNKWSQSPWWERHFFEYTPLNTTKERIPNQCANIEVKEDGVKIFNLYKSLHHLTSQSIVGSTGVIDTTLMIAPTLRIRHWWFEQKR